MQDCKFAAGVGFAVGVGQQTGETSVNAYRRGHDSSLRRGLYVARWESHKIVAGLGGSATSYKVCRADTVIHERGKWCLLFCKVTWTGGLSTGRGG